MGITNETYFEVDEFMSVSEYKKLIKCEFAGKLPWDNTNKSVALMVGSYVDAYIEGTLEKFKLDNPEIFSTRGESKGELKSDYKQAEEICRYIDNDKRIQQFLSGEKQRIMTGVINGVPFKIKMDAYSEGIAINDLKVMRTVTDNSGEFYDFITPWGYDIQLACYQEIVYQNTGKKLPCFIVAVTKETPIDSVIIAVPQNYLDKALYQVQSSIQHLYEVKLGKVEASKCGKCKACVSARETTPIISLDTILTRG